ncbi:arginine--tRNA ligase [candidate division NPL-UPA2 bacterium Unc8]|uniref:Arginine--tRNA ligase n=1 Tax=candidate division NPL-UPA2 bacterium Unc8 TaxID=1980939 RepID=A0A399FY34_UNCN2|nr:MAG: arginine--tRNA ligase [candidate division NPL-UPA2 bacterium Unc8]
MLILVKETSSLLKEALVKIGEKTGMRQFPSPYLEIPHETRHGDLSTNVALQLAKQSGLPPLKIAEDIVKLIAFRSPVFSRIEVAPPGFINFFFKPEIFYPIINRIIREGSRYGCSNFGEGKRVLLEFVSANPTGPLTVAHGRHAAVGDAIARILRMAGYTVVKEYYYNDSGRQMELLGRSLYARYKEASGAKADIGEDGYHGEYLRELAREITNDEAKKDIDFFSSFAEKRIFAGIKQDLSEFRVDFDSWIKEKDLYESGAVDRVIEELRKAGEVYEEEGALWLRSSLFGDEKDRVIRRRNKEPTYIAPDIAYHHQKYERGFDLLIDLFGPDHHGYSPRLWAALTALGHDRGKLKIIIVQLVSLYRGKEKISMSTRKGEFITLRQVLHEVGGDVARFFFLMRKTDSHLNFDIELAKSESLENPVYYVQYVHARSASIMKVARENAIAPGKDADLSFLREEEEIAIMKKLAQFPDVITGCAKNVEPQPVTGYLQDLAKAFHNYYNHFRVINPDNQQLTQARLRLVVAVKTVIANGLTLLGIPPCEKM